MIPIYSKLFNFIFDKGVVPVTWSVGVITHIFKNKGNSKDPKNYTSFTPKSMKVKNSFFFVERYKLIRLCKIKILSAVE
jgi:hypothetical protein